MPAARLSDRAVVEVAGADAAAFLDRLVTSSVDGLLPGAARHAALLTPQGKIIADFVCIAAEGEEPRFRLDVAASSAADLVKRLTLYRLRAKVAVAQPDGLAIVAGWDATPIPTGAGVAEAVQDPRLPALGWRAIVEAGVERASVDADEGAYHAHRISLGVPEGGRDFGFNDAFPHEAVMDQLRGVDFDKGCYVGQEVVSRMQHRGTARTRIVPLVSDDPLPPAAEVVAGERALGRTGSAAGRHGLAMLRLDRVADALAAGVPITARGVPVRLVRPDWVRFAFPGDDLKPAA